MRAIPPRSPPTLMLVDLSIRFVGHTGRAIGTKGPTSLRAGYGSTHRSIKIGDPFRLGAPGFCDHHAGPKPSDLRSRLRSRAWQQISSATGRLLKTTVSRRTNRY